MAYVNGRLRTPTGFYSVRPIWEKKRIIGYRVSRSESRKLYDERHYPLRHESLEEVKQRVENRKKILNSQLPRVMGYPARVDRQGEWPVSFLPIGVTYSFHLHSNHKTPALSFSINCYKDEELRSKMFKIALYNPKQYTEEEFVHLCRVAIDLRCFALGDYFNGKPTDLSQYKRGRWRDIEPQNSITPPFRFHAFIADQSDKVLQT